MRVSGSKLHVSTAQLKQWPNWFIKESSKTYLEFSDSDVEAALKEIDEEEKGLLDETDTSKKSADQEINDQPDAQGKLIKYSK